MTSRRGMHLGAITNLFVRCREFHAPTELQMRNTWQLFNLRLYFIQAPSLLGYLYLVYGNDHYNFSDTSPGFIAQISSTSTRVKRCRDYTYIPASSPNEEYAIFC